MKTKGQKKSNIGLKRMLLAFGAFALLAAGCTQDPEYKVEPKHDVIAKASIDTESIFMYLPSSLETDLGVSAARPHWMGDDRLAKFRFTESALEIVEISIDARKNENPANLKVLISIPVEHLAYRCKTDAYGECTQQEEEDESLAWNQRSSFKMKLSEMKIMDVNFLPIKFESHLIGCYKETGAEIVSYAFENGAFNIITENSFAAGVECADDIKDVKDLNFKMRFQHSLARLKDIESPKYTKVQYPRTDESTFGFFSTEQVRLDVDNRDSIESEMVLINRWNPHRDEVLYYLSDEFEKPENAVVKAATLEGIQILNEGLAEAGVKFRIKTAPAKGRSPGDIRHSSIVLMEDPHSAGPIGYGPSAANRYTGEILSARTIMYLGTIKRGLINTYEEIVATMNAPETTPTGANLTTPKAFSLLLEPFRPQSPAPPAGGGGQTKPPVGKPTDSGAAGHVHSVAHGEHATPEQRFVSQLSQLAVQRGHSHNHSNTGSIDDLIHGRTLADLIREVSDPTLRRVDDSNELLNIRKEAKHCGYPSDMAETSRVFRSALPQLFESGQKPKAWNELGEEEKTAILNKLIPVVWIPVLVHEIGHNLGLRHNFGGSEDKANFYTQEELTQRGFSGNFEYSSVMDYSYRQLNELRLLGKYDVAALRFGYNRQLEDINGKIIQLPQDASYQERLVNVEVPTQTAIKDVSGVEFGIEELKSFRYCTDEHVDVNPGCNRFDEGSSYSEIAEHMVKAYDELYRKRNFRRGLRSFSLIEDKAHYSRVRSYFLGLRRMIELYERLSKISQITPTHWQTIPFFIDIKSAAVTAGKFFIKVVSTPDVHCLATTTADPTQLLVAPLLKVDDRHINCEALRSNPNLNYIGQVGRLFHSKKSPDSTNPYVDQIDVRGVWLDKIAALDSLFQRRLGISTFDRNRENVLNIPELIPSVIELIVSLVLDDFHQVLNVEGTAGLSLVALSYGLEGDVDGSHRIETLTSGIVKATKLRVDNQTFTSVALDRFGMYLSEEPTSDPVGDELLNAMTIYGQLPSGEALESAGGQFRSIKTSTTTYYYKDDSTLTDVIAKAYVFNRLLESFDLEKLNAILQAVQQGASAPESASPQEKLAYGFKAEFLEKHLDGRMGEPGGFRSSKYYERVLSELPRK